jgi:coproporphyrinogen III oxidase-like Fe-S oxidoreductase
MLGFGPSAISWAADRGYRQAFKTLNPDRSDDYLSAVTRRGPAWDRSFRYDAPDLHIFYLTCRLAALHIDCGDYRSLFGTDALADFSGEFAALAPKQLVQVTADSIRPTPAGMFYADSIASLLAARRIREHRARPGLSRSRTRQGDRANDNGHGYM